MATAEQIRERSLRKLGIKAVGQTTQSEVATDIDSAYAEVYAQLEKLELASWEIGEDVPDEFVSPVVWLVADSRKDEYSIPNDRYQRISLDGDRALPKIREMLASNVYKTPPADYY
jgi:hypothetical protein